MVQLNYNDEAMRFKTLSEFKSSLLRGGEIVIEWAGDAYGIFYNGTQFYVTTSDYKTTWYDDPDQVLEYEINGARLRDIIKEVAVLDRAL